MGTWVHTKTEVDESALGEALAFLEQTPVCEDLYQGTQITSDKFTESFDTACNWAQAGSLEVGVQAHITSACLQTLVQQDANALTCALLPAALAQLTGSDAIQGTCRAASGACDCTFLAAEVGPNEGTYHTEKDELTLRPADDADAGAEDAGDAGVSPDTIIQYTIKGNEMVWTQALGESRFKRK